MPQPPFPSSPKRLCHLALAVADLDRSEHFYGALLGMRVGWRPDGETVHLTNGADDLALHRVDDAVARSRIDHLGFVVSDASEVDAWHAHLANEGVSIASPPRDHRDGSRSFYCADPDGNTVQVLHHPRLEA